MPSKHIVVSNFEVFKEVVENAGEVGGGTAKSFCQFK
jgi:hypothetical protein